MLSLVCGNEGKFPADLTRRLATPAASERLLRPSAPWPIAGTPTAKAKVPADLFAEKTGNQLPEDRSGVNTHIKDREACIASGTAFRI